MKMIVKVTRKPEKKSPAMPMTACNRVRHRRRDLLRARLHVLGGPAVAQPGELVRGAQLFDQRRKILEEVSHRADERNQEQQPDQQDQRERAEHQHRRPRSARQLRLRHQVPQGELEHEGQEDPDEDDQEGVADRRERREHTQSRSNQQHRSHRQDQPSPGTHLHACDLRSSCQLRARGSSGLVARRGQWSVRSRDLTSRHCVEDRIRAGEVGRAALPHTNRMISRRSRVELLQRFLDVVAERERDLRGATDDARGARHRRHGLEGGDDLVARRPGREGERTTACWKRGRSRRRRRSSRRRARVPRSSRRGLTRSACSSSETITSTSASSCTASRRRCSL